MTRHSGRCSDDRAGGAPDRAPGMGAGRLLLGLAGVALIAVGALELFAVVGSGQAPLPAVAGWLLAGPVLVDALLVPVAVLSGMLVHRYAGAWAVRVTVGLVLSLFVVLVGWPFVGGFGRVADNPSLLDRNYRWGLLALLAVSWGIALAGPARWWRGRRHGRGR